MTANGKVGICIPILQYGEGGLPTVTQQVKWQSQGSTQICLTSKPESFQFYGTARRRFFDIIPRGKAQGTGMDS